MQNHKKNLFLIIFFSAVFIFGSFSYVYGDAIFCRAGQICEIGEGPPQCLGLVEHYVILCDCGDLQKASCIDEAPYQCGSGPEAASCNTQDSCSCGPPPPPIEELGTVCVASNLPTSWTLSGPLNFNESGPGHCRDVDVGTYSIGNVPNIVGHTLSISPNGSQALSNGDSIGWNITYTPDNNPPGQGQWKCLDTYQCGWDASAPPGTPRQCNVGPDCPPPGGNTAPSNPIISGPTTGNPSVNYTYTFLSTDPEDNQIRYAIDWDMNQVIDEWLPAPSGAGAVFTNSGVSLATPHNWPTVGVKNFQARTYDNLALGSGWTPYTVTIGSSSMSGWLTAAYPPPCIIPVGLGTCNINFSWSVTNPELVGKTDILRGPGMTVVRNDQDVGNNVSLAVPHVVNPRTYYLVNNNVTLAQVTVSSDCAAGTTWDAVSSTCVASAAPTCTSAAPQAPSTTGTSGTFYAYAYGVSSDVTSVTFPSWIIPAGGQNDIVWYPGTNMGGGTWRASINLGNHTASVTEFGTMKVHVYMTSGGYTNIFCGSADFQRTQASTLNYTLSNPGTLNVTKSSGDVLAQHTITKSLISGVTEPVTLAVSGPVGPLPSGITVDSISNQGCSPSCVSTITFRVSSSAPVGTHSITVVGTPLDKQTTFNLIVSPAPAGMNVSCSASPSPALIGQTVTWTANVSGGTPPYTYLWSGTNIPPNVTTNPFNISYSTLGSKVARVRVTDSTSAFADCSDSTIQINFNPVFEEF